MTMCALGAGFPGSKYIYVYITRVTGWGSRGCADVQ